VILLVVPQIETNAFCIYSQMKGFSSSEIAAMIERPVLKIVNRTTNRTERSSQNNRSFADKGERQNTSLWIDKKNGWNSWLLRARSRTE
jgi:hypothetical protein